MMKMIFIGLTLFILQAQGAILAQTITLSSQQTSMESVFRQIKEQTDYHVICHVDILARTSPITIDATDMPLEKFLDLTLTPQNLTYIIKNNSIVVTPRVAEPATVQERIYSGVVIAASGIPLADISIAIRGRRTVTSSDREGRFNLLAESGSVLVFSHVGYQTHTLVLGTQTALTISMAVQEETLEEVVVVGYGTQKRVNLTGSVATVDFDELENIPQANTVNILSGRLPGVSVVQSGGQPGADGSEVAIRGLGTLNDPTPLVIIDGVPSTLEDFGNLPAQDVASVSVLKDASSAAIYGARGGNGVILVTTRLPTEERINIRLSAYTGLQQATYLPEMVESWQYMALMNEAVDVVRYPEALIDSARNGIFSDNIANTKWFDHLFDVAPMQQYSLAVSGKTRGTTFQFSGAFLDQDGIMRNTNSQRYTIRGVINTNINKFIKAGLNVWGFERKNSEPFLGINPLIRQSLLVPIMPVRYENGEYATYNMNIRAAGGQLIDNPILNSEIGHTHNNTLKINVQPSIDIALWKGLNLRSAFTYSVDNGLINRFNPTFSHNSNFGLPAYENKISNLINQDNRTQQVQWQTTLAYQTVLPGNQEFNALLGHEILEYKHATFRAQGDNLPSNELPVLSNATANFQVSGSKQEWALQSFFGRVNYAYDKRYLAEFSLRTDGSSRLGGQYRLSPSGSVGWVVSQEPFFSSLKRAVPFLKFRAGYGKLGNDRIGNYTFQQTLNLAGYYTVGGALQTAAAITAYGNPQISWEQTSTTNIGMDLGLLNNRLNFNLDLYERVTDGILFQLPLPLSFGNPDAPMQNIATVANSGMELAFSYRNKRKANFRYSIGGNIAYNQNEIKKLNKQRVIVGGGAAGLTLLEEGYPIHSWFGYVADGLYTQADEDQGYPKFHQANVVGSLKFVDINEDGVINDQDRTVIGDGTTPIIFGLNAGISFKGVDVSFLFQGIADKDIYIYGQGNRPGNGGQINFWQEWWTRSYHPERNPDGDWPIIKSQSPDASASSSFYLSNASYIRFKNVEIGYSLPSRILDHVKMSKARFYLSGQNLFTWSSVPRNLDPERSNFQKNNFNYPQTQVFTFGVNVVL